LGNTFLNLYPPLPEKCLPALAGDNVRQVKKIALQQDI
jgi:hypothetical protein